MWSPHSGPDPFSTYPTQPALTHTVTVLHCAFSYSSATTIEDPLPCLYFPTKTASEMYGICFGAWPRPKATPRPESPALDLLLTPKGELRVSVQDKVSTLEGQRRGTRFLGLFLDRELFTVFCFQSQSLSFLLSVGPQADVQGGFLDLFVSVKPSRKHKTQRPRDPAAFVSERLFFIGQQFECSLQKTVAQIKQPWFMNHMWSSSFALRGKCFTDVKGSRGWGKGLSW